MSIKECSHHKDKKKKSLRRFCAGFLIFSFIILFIILLVWAILQPKKPRFVLQDATVFAFNVTSNPNLLTSNFQVTFTSRNPNDKIGVYYDRLHVYATYRSQQITYYTEIPPTYQGHKEVNVWSPFIYGTDVPVAPYNGLGLAQDQSDGNVMLVVRINGRVRFKVGTFITGRYHLHVKCEAPISFGGSRGSGIVVGNAIKYQFIESCSVSV